MKDKEFRLPDKKSPTGIELTPDEKEDKFEEVLFVMVETGAPLRKALRMVQLGVGTFYSILTQSYLSRYKGTEIELKGELITITDALIGLRKEERRIQYAHACDISIEVMFDETIEIADDDSNDTITKKDAEGNEFVVPNVAALQRSKQMTDARHWYITKRMPKKYGNKVENTVVGDEARPVALISLGSGKNPEEGSKFVGLGGGINPEEEE